MSRYWTEEMFARHGHRTRDEQIAYERAAAKRRNDERKGIDRTAILDRDQHRCRYCGALAGGLRFSLAIDHVVPFSRGGTADPSNLAAACRSCNSRKKNRTPEEAGMHLLPIPARDQ